METDWKKLVKRSLKMNLKGEFLSNEGASILLTTDEKTGHGLLTYIFRDKTVNKYMWKKGFGYQDCTKVLRFKNIEQTITYMFKNDIEKVGFGPFNCAYCGDWHFEHSAENTYRFPDELVLKEV